MRVWLRIMLLDVLPQVWRQVLVPATVELTDLHHIILAAMGWSGEHMHEFDFGAVRFGEPDEDRPDERLRDGRGIKGGPFNPSGFDRAAADKRLKAQKI